MGTPPAKNRLTVASKWSDLGLCFVFCVLYCAVLCLLRMAKPCLSCILQRRCWPVWVQSLLCSTYVFAQDFRFILIGRSDAASRIARRLAGFSDEYYSKPNSRARISMNHPHPQLRTVGTLLTLPCRYIHVDVLPYSGSLVVSSSHSAYTHSRDS